MSSRMMPTELTAAVRRFARSRLDALALDRRGGIPAELLRELADLGLFGLSIPEDFGGLGLSLGEVCEVVAALAEADRSVATTVGLHVGLGTHGLLLFGSEEQKRALLPDLASGATVASFAATEPSAGSDLQSARTVARVEGDELVVDGEKCYVTNGGFAGLFTVLARTPGLGGRRAHGLLVIPRDTPGVVVGAEEHKLGIRASSTVTLHLDGVRIPRANLLGAPGQGMAQAHAILAIGRTVMAAGCLGTARRALALAHAHGRQRIQFRRPIGDMEASRAHLARMAALVHGMRGCVAEVCRRWARGASIDTTSTVAKVFCSEAAFEVTDRAVQLHGALGFLEETGVPLLARDCRVTRIFEGANDVLLVRLGAALLANRALHDERIPPDPTPSASTEEARLVDARIRVEADRLAERFGVRVVERQTLLAALARAHVNVSVVGSLLRSEPTPTTELVATQLLDAAQRQLDQLPTIDARASLERRVVDALADTPPSHPESPRP